MRKVILSAFFIALTANAGHAHTPIEKASGQIVEEIFASTAIGQAGIAVMPFQNPNGQISGLGRLISDAINDTVVRSGKYAVLDRAFVSRLLEEIKFNQAGFTEQKTAVQLGRFGGAQFMLLGNIELYGKKEFLVSARLVQTETSIIAGSAKVRLKFSEELEKLYGLNAAVDTSTADMPTEGKARNDAAFLNTTGRKGCRWAEVRASVPLLSGAPAARALAISLARQKAVGMLSGSRHPVRIDFEDSTMLGELENILRLTKNSEIEEEKIAEESSDGKTYSLTLQACLRSARKKIDRDFKVELLLNQNSFISGQEARALAVTSKDAWLYIFSADFDGNVIPVFPGPTRLLNKIKAGESFAFPDETHRKAGISLIAQLPDGAESSVETLWALAVKRDVSALLDGIATISGITGALDAAGEEWTDDIRVYTIRK